MELVVGPTCEGVGRGEKTGEVNQVREEQVTEQVMGAALGGIVEQEIRSQETSSCTIMLRASRIQDERTRKKKKLTGSLNLTTIHREHQARAPIEEALPNRVPHRLDRLTRDGAHRLGRDPVLLERGRDRDVFEEDGHALHRLVAEWALRRRELERVRDLVRDVFR